MSERKEGCRHHRRLAGHRRCSCRSLSRPRLRGGRDGTIDQTNQRRPNPSGARRHFQPEDRRECDFRRPCPVRAHRYAHQLCWRIHRQAVHSVPRLIMRLCWASISRASFTNRIAISAGDDANLPFAARSSRDVAGEFAPGYIGLLPRLGRGFHHWGLRFGTRFSVENP
jgi:hypothetical protein